MSTHQQIQLAKSLSPRLIRFFQRFPPPALLQNVSTPALTTAETASTTAPPNPNASPIEASTSTIETPASGTATISELPYHNPFLPRKDYVSGRWHGPVYGLRKQAELVKLAQTHGVLDLLPWTIKKPGEKEKRRIERGLQVKGTGVGESVKGKKWERTLKGRLEMRRQAMLGMPELIEEWKRKGHGRGWKKWPSGKPKRQ